MTYDPKKQEIKIDGSQADFEKDLFSAFEHIAQQVAKDREAVEMNDVIAAAGLARRAAEAKENAEKLAIQMSNSRSSQKLREVRIQRRALIAVFLFWTAFVILRTAGDYELWGIEFDSWDASYFFINWLLPVAALFAVVKVYRWVTAPIGSASPVAKRSGQWRIRRPSELSNLERSMHLGLYPLVLIPLGLYIGYSAFAEKDELQLLMGVAVAVSPFFVLLTRTPPRE